MKSAKSPCSTWLLLGAALVVFGYVFSSPLPASAQTYPPCAKGQGFNAAYGNCTNGSPNGSFALIDASQYMNQGDICAAIHAIFANYNGNNSYGTVVDARGFHPGISQGCSTNPWASLNPLPYSSVVLLPPGTITLSTTWTLPSYTSVVGQGPNVTIIQAGSGFSGEIIDMGTNTICPEAFADCPSVQIEHLGVNGSNIAGVTAGIKNGFSQEKSWVNDVAFTNIANIALDIENSNAFNSGPYTNLTMSNVGTCLKIKSFPTRGVHGLTCSTTGSSSGAAIYLDAINNSLEDIYIQGGASQDGILVGSQAAAGNNLLFNISGSGLNSVVHICGSSNAGHCLGIGGASDITLLGIKSLSAGNTIEDDLSGTTITDSTVGMYIIGEPVQGQGASIGYSRFTTSTSTNAATWLVGPNAPAQTPNCANGDLFSQTTVGTPPNTTLWGCGGGQWYAIK
jgi:hypothetical protein